jgi:hypothetical protein
VQHDESAWLAERELDRRHTLPWNDPVLAVRSDPPMRATYRRLQSWYRDKVLGAAHPRPAAGGARIVGSSFSDAEVATDRALNFLGDPEILRYVDQRVPQVRRCGGTLDEHRLRHNLLSSMPMAFSFIGALRSAPDRAEIVSRLFDVDAADVLIDRLDVGDPCGCWERSTHAEWSPDPALHLHDRTAFDAAIWYRTSGGDLGLIGVETKYTEPLSQKEYDRETYREITEHSAEFVDGAADRLVRNDTNQLWRNLLLALSLRMVDDPCGRPSEVRLAVVGLESDQSLWDSTDTLRQQLRGPDQLVVNRAWEDLVDRLRGTSMAGFGAFFSERYLDLGPLQEGAATTAPISLRRSVNGTESERIRTLSPPRRRLEPSPEATGNDPDWGRWVPATWRAAIDPTAQVALPHRPPADVIGAAGYWAPLLHLALYSLGWPSPAHGLYHWDRLGRPLEDRRLALIESLWGYRLDAALRHLWMNQPGFDLDLPGTTAMPDLGSAPDAWRRPVLAASYVEHNPATGGSDPLHLHHVVNGATDDSVSHRTDLRPCDPGSSRQPRAVFTTDNYAGWYRRLADRATELPTTPGGSGWRIDVVIEPIGFVGTYRRSRASGRWFNGQHRWHELGYRPGGPSDE